MIVLTSLMMPSIVTMIPTFVMWSKLGFTNSLVPLAVPIWFGGSVYNIFLFRQFFLSIPRELDEAAYVDGASYFKVYWKIILPLSKSAMVVVGIFSFLGSWNDFMGPLIYLNEEKKYTLSLGLQLFQGSYGAQWPPAYGGFGAGADACGDCILFRAEAYSGGDCNNGY